MKQQWRPKTITIILMIILLIILLIVAVLRQVVAQQVRTQETTQTSTSETVLNEPIEQGEDLLSRRMVEEPLPQTTTTPLTTSTPTPTPIPEPTPIPKKNGVECTSKERVLFEQIVSAEAGQDWNLKGAWLIAQTIVNQLNSKDYGNTLYKVLIFPGNYSVYSSGYYKTIHVTENAKLAINLVLEGEMPTDINITKAQAESILYFCTRAHLKNHPKGFHANRPIVIQYDNVIFFR